MKVILCTSWPAVIRWSAGEEPVSVEAALAAMKEQTKAPAMPPAGGLCRQPAYSVEAEYGDKVCEGSLLTLAHHGDRAGNPAPCLFEGTVPRPEAPVAGFEGPEGSVEAVAEVQEEVILVSHLDLDTLGGVLAIQGRKPAAVFFWEAAAHVDVHGPHTLAPTCPELPLLRAYWRWAETLPRFRGDLIVDVSEIVDVAHKALKVVLDEDEYDHEVYLQAGAEWAEKEDRLNAATFAGTCRRVLLRRCQPDRPAFVNHLYRTPRAYGSRLYDVVASLGADGAITLSFAKPLPGVSCETILQMVFGPEAGGRETIGGSPRGQKMTWADLERLVNAVNQALEALP